MTITSLRQAAEAEDTELIIQILAEDLTMEYKLRLKLRFQGKNKFIKWARKQYKL